MSTTQVIRPPELLPPPEQLRVPAGGPLPVRPPQVAAGPINCLSVDLEDYFHCEAFAHLISPGQWSRRKVRLDRTVPRLLEIFEANGVKATFFVLGWVARRYPRLIRRIAALGHEIASHGYWHQHLDRMTRRSFREDVRVSRTVLEDATGQAVMGFRAPTFSLTCRTAWAVEILVEEGFTYDSSIFPIYHDRYGVPKAPGGPFWLEGRAGRILELPPLTVGSGRLKFPVAGGGYLRVLPAGVVSWAIRRANAGGRPAVLYVHPWELDRRQPRLPLGRVSAIRHYVGMGRMEGRVRRLVRDHDFRPMIALARQQTGLCRDGFTLSATTE